MTRPRQAALAERPVRHIGRMGITETTKRPGDYYWNGRAQRWETVPAIVKETVVREAVA